MGCKRKSHKTKKEKKQNGRCAFSAATRKSLGWKRIRFLSQVYTVEKSESLLVCVVRTLLRVLLILPTCLLKTKKNFKIPFRSLPSSISVSWFF